MHRRCPAVLAALAVLVLATGCADDAAPDPSPDSPPSDETVRVPEAGEDPPGISVRLHQLRAGYGSRELQLQVVNNTDRLIRVDRATYVSPSFVRQAVWDDGTRIPGGFTIDLPVTMPESRCTPDPDVGESVSLEFRHGDSGLLRKTYDPEELYESVQNIVDADCTRRAIERVADVRPAADIEIHGEGRQSTAVLPIIVEPTGEPGSFTLDSVAATTLLSPATGGDSWRVGVAVDEDSGGKRHVLEIRPTRCDSHALADNSQGTELTATFTLEGETTTVVLGTSNYLEGRLTSFVASHCGYGPDID